MCQRNLRRFNLVISAAFLLQLVQTCCCIKLIEVSIPPHAIRGQNAKLSCNYDMEGDKLYSIKWYRNGHEFYRYIPSDEPKTTVFNGDGLNIDSEHSTETEILLRSVELDTTGLFRCEVSGEAPLFQTAYREAAMAVVDLPDDGPVISGGYPRYHIGDKVNVNCTSYKSKPAAKLRWYINGELADPALTKIYPVIVDKAGLETSALGLWFKVREKHFKQGDLKLKCTATIATIYWKSNEESVQGVRPQSALVSESRSSRNSATADNQISDASMSSDATSSASKFATVIFATTTTAITAANLLCRIQQFAIIG